MKKKIKFRLNYYISLLLLTVFALSCTKVEKGYLSPTMAYAVNEFTVQKGRTSSSYTLVNDGSSIPMVIKMIHVYDETGKIVDDIFTKTYPVSVWTEAYNPATDTTYAAIMAKHKMVEMAPININETSGQFVSNPATVYLPSGRFTFDLEVSNVVGSQVLKSIMTIVIQEGKTIETSPESGSYSVYRMVKNSGSSLGALNNMPNNPFVMETIIRYADTPNIITYSITDKNGKHFNPKLKEFNKRPNSGLNPIPPYLQNLQDYAPDTYFETDTSISVKYPLVPFPIISLGNGFNMYYQIPTRFVQIDSTSSYTANAPGNYYKGTTDSHFLGYYINDSYDYSLRTPLRIQVPGAYLVRLKLLNTTHR